MKKAIAILFGWIAALALFGVIVGLIWVDITITVALWFRIRDLCS